MLVGEILRISFPMITGRVSIRTRNGLLALTHLVLGVSATGLAQSTYSVTARGSFAGEVGDQLSGSVQVSVLKNGTPAVGVEVLLRSDELPNVALIETARQLTDKNGKVTFDKAWFSRVGAFVSADERLTNLHAIVDDERVPLRDVDVRIMAPRRLVLTTSYTQPRRIVAAAPHTWEFRVRTDGKVSLPVKNASVTLILPNDGNRESRKSDELGQVSFPNVVIPPGLQRSDNVRASLPSGEELQIPIQLAPGNVDSVEVKTTAGGAYRAGERFAATVIARDRFGNTVEGASVSLSVISAVGYLDLPRDADGKLLKVETNERGVASFPDIAYYGPVGEARLAANVDAVTREATLVVVPGRPSEIVELEAPPATIRADSLIHPAPKVRVQDAAGNPIKDAMVRARICRIDVSGRCTISATDTIKAAVANALSPSGHSAITFPAQLLGTRSVKTDASGDAQFDALRFVGPSGQYALVFDIPQLNVEWLSKTSTLMYYDGDAEFNRNFVAISAIKSVAGSKPSNEFFDIRFRFRLFSHLTGMVHSDLALTRSDVSDTASRNVSSAQRRLVDASFQLNFESVKTDEQRSVPERALVAGSHVRVFSTVPFMGVHVGSIEMARSVFHGSSLTVGYTAPLDRTPVAFDGGTLRPSRHNVVVDGFVRSDHVGFFEYLNIRAGILIPLRDRGRRPISRIVLAVPIGKLISF